MKMTTEAWKSDSWKAMASWLPLTAAFVISVAPAMARPCLAEPKTVSGPAVVLNTFGSEKDLQLIAANDGASAALAPGGGLLARFQNGSWPTLKWAAPVGGTWDWSKNSTIALSVSNPGDKAVALNVRVDDGPPVWSARPEHVHSGSALVQPHATGTFFMDLAVSANNFDSGMRCQPLAPGRAGMTEMVGTGSLDPSHVIAYMIFVSHPIALVSLKIDRIWLLPKQPAVDPYEKIVDEFGQYSREEWPGKVHEVAELRESALREEANSRTLSNLGDRDEYGGWAGGPTLPATGSFRTVQIKGRWWFVDPLGHIYWALGINGPEMEEPTLITGRERMFIWLPGAGDPLAAHFAPLRKDVFLGPAKTGLTYSFYTANLERKFGPGYVAKWQDETVNRLKAWGINSVSGWENPLAGENAIPYIKVLSVGGHHAKIPAGGWGPMDDPWDPQFAADAELSFSAKAKPLNRDPLCLGFMVGNEMSWGKSEPDSSPSDHYHLAIAALGLVPSSPAKQFLVAMLQKKYGEITQFNQAWDISVPDWATLLNAPLPAPATLNAAMQSDASDFLTAHANQWFSVVRNALQAAAPQKLFLGCRFAQFTPEAVAAAGRYADVVSFNIYGVRQLDSGRWGFFQTLGKPVLISEWHFGATDRGLFGAGLGPAANQADRAQAYQEFAEDLLDNPALVGEQWFQFNDQPVTGRSFDGENFGIGLVSVTDDPYPELIGAVRAVSAEAYRRRGSGPPAA